MTTLTAAAAATTSAQSAQATSAEAILAAMSPAERVGQLFVVGFYGASAGQGSGVLSQFRHLILPAIPLVLILFGYISRMARAGTIEALNSDYTRTAVLKGLPETTVIRRHVLRNSLLPTITVIATQTGYLIGGLVVVETLFNYQGLGNLIYKAAVGHDFAMLEAGVLIIGVVYVVATLIADLLLTLLNPRLRIGGTQ